MAGVTIMLIALAAALPSWRYVMKNDREEELLFRGEQISNAIIICQGKMKIVPTSLDMLVKNKCLRRPYKDPMTADGKWRLLAPGQAIPVRPPGSSSSTTPSPSPSPSSGGLGSGQVLGPFNGVVSRSTEKSLRKFNTQNGQGDSYDKWYFVAGQPFSIGRPLMPLIGVPGRGSSPRPPGAPTPPTAPTTQR